MNSSTPPDWNSLIGDFISSFCEIESAAREFIYNFSNADDYENLIRDGLYKQLGFCAQTVRQFDGIKDTERREISLSLYDAQSFLSERNLVAHNPPSVEGWICRETGLPVFIHLIRCKKNPNIYITYDELTLLSDKIYSVNRNIARFYVLVAIKEAEGRDFFVIDEYHTGLKVASERKIDGIKTRNKYASETKKSKSSSQSEIPLFA